MYAFSVVTMKQSSSLRIDKLRMCTCRSNPILVFSNIMFMSLVARSNIVCTCMALMESVCLCTFERYRDARGIEGGRGVYC